MTINCKHIAELIMQIKYENMHRQNKSTNKISFIKSVIYIFLRIKNISIGIT